MWIISLFSYSFWISQDKIDYLKSLNISIDNQILSKQQISRYEAARYLNYAQCFDCLVSTKNIKDKFNYGWFSNFKKQPNFYLNDIDPQDKYYYCVSSLASLDYIHGYPKTNPICGWDFCGSNSLSYGELFQIVVNIISNKILNKYNIDNIDKFYTNMMSIKWTSDQTNMNITENSYKIVDKIKNSWLTSYQIQNFDEFYLYEKYCNLFPKSCGYKEFGNIKKWNYMLSIVNILYKENLLTYKEAININPQKLISWEELIKWLYKVKKINTCKINYDHDYDGILDQNDSCPDTYNPNQKDTDHDGIWDVCDDDIDNDSIKNPIWIVDDLWNIIVNKITPNIDNCLFTKNLTQKDTNNNKIGDACENKWNDLIWIEIVCTPLAGNVPLDTKCKAKIIWPVKKIVWTYDGQVIWKWKTIPYTFLTDWDKKITATAIWENNDTASANSFFKVWKKETNNWYGMWLQITPTPSSWPEWTKVTFSSQIKWDPDYILWEFGDGSKYKKKPWVNPIKTYPKEWNYTVIAKAYKDWKVTATSSSVVKIYKKWNKSKLPTSYLKSNPLIWNINQNINFTLTTKNINPDQIKKVVWNFWDSKTKVTSTLSTKHPFSSNWSYPVSATIYLKDGTKLPNTITQKIISNDKKYGAVITSNPLQQDIWKKVNFQLKPKWFKQDDIKNIVWLYGDGNSSNGTNLKSTHTYYKSDKYPVNAIITLNNGNIIYTSMTEAIVWNNICSNLEKAKKILKCDMDHDGIPDMCDDDIDWDWVKNLLWIIKFDNKDCSITNDNIDLNRLNEEHNLAKKWWNIDNCLFTNNPDQIDSNSNGIWDGCENNNNPNIWLQIIPNPSSWPEWTKISFSSQIKWEPDYLIWDFWDGTTKKTLPWVNPIKTYPKKWNYTIIAKAYKDWKVAATSSTVVKIYKKWDNSKLPTSYLKSNPLVWNINQNIDFSLTTKNINTSKIDKVVWDFWDWNTKTTSTLSTKHPYSSAWAYPVSTTIYLKDWTTIPNSITQKIISIVKINNTKDTDQDGIPDDVDACPTIPENKNWIEDKDGCPEIPTEINNKFTFAVDNCNTCPCHFADYKTAFLPWMKIQAILVNPFNPSQIYKVSKMKVVK